MNLRAVIGTPGFQPVVKVFFAIALALTLCRCPHQARPAAPLTPPPYFPIQPGSAWAFQVTHWDYPSRLDAAPLAFTMEQVFQMVSLQPRDHTWRILTEPALTALFFPEGLNSAPLEWVQDPEGIWMVWSPEKKKPGARVLVLPDQPAPGRSWSGTAPQAMTLEFRLLPGEPSPAALDGAKNAPELDLADTLILEIELASGGKTSSRRIRLARDLGPVSLEAYTDFGSGPRLTDRWRRTDLSPFAPQGTATSF